MGGNVSAVANAAGEREAVGIVDEFRDAREYVDVVLKFKVLTETHVLEGVTFSQKGFTIRREALCLTSDRWVELSESSFSAFDHGFRLRIDLSGFVLEFSVNAEPVFGDAPDHDYVTFRFTSVSAKNRSALNRVIRAYLSGALATSDELVRAQDNPTRAAIALEKTAMASQPVSNRKWANILALGCSVTVITVALAFAATSIYGQMFTTESEYAALTAPKIDFLSPVQAQVTSIAAVGDSDIRRDEMLFELRSNEIKSDIQNSRAKIEFLGAVKTDGDAKLETVFKIASIASISDPRAATDEQPRSNAHALNYEIGLQKALELRKSGLTAYSPCDCEVFWALETGSWVQQGDRIATLARTGISELRVEALIKLKSAKNLHAGQHAYVRFPDIDETVGATVEAVSLDGDISPRVGFPEWLRRDPTVATVTLRLQELPSKSAVGAPVEVVIIR